MHLKERLKLLLKTLNPDSYERLNKELSLGEAWKQFFFTYRLLFGIMLLLFIPAMLFKAPLLENQFEAFDSFDLSGNFNASEPITLLHHPDVVVDLTADRGLDGEELLFTRDAIYWKKFFLFGESSTEWSAVRDVTQVSSLSLLIFLLFLAPSLAFWLGFLNLLKHLIVVLIFSVIAFFLPRIWRHKLSFGTAMKLSLFASTIMILVELMLLPFWRNWWIPLLLYVIFLAIGIALVGDRELSHKKGKKGKHHEIWE